MRPKIICHMVSSIDGRLLPERWTPPTSGKKAALLDIYEEVADQLDADGWMIGRKTMAYYAQGTPQKTSVTYPNLRETFVASGRQRCKVAVGIDPHGKLHYQQDKINGNHAITILGEQVTDEYLAELRTTGISYLFAGKDGQNIQQAMETLGDTFGIKTLLLEGGGLINGSFLCAKLIDEISLLIYPGIDGLAGIPSIFEYIGQANEKPAQGLALNHIATATLAGGMVWLRYQVKQL